jgi:hypothetical protein
MITKFYIAGILVAFTLCGAFPLSAKCQESRRDATVSVGHSYDDDAWKRLIDSRISEEAAGKRSPPHSRLTWKEYWTSSYDVIRNSPGLPWKPSQFRTKEEMIRYIKDGLKAHGLPTYE